MNEGEDEERRGLEALLQLNIFERIAPQALGLTREEAEMFRGDITRAVSDAIEDTVADLAPRRQP